MKLPIEQEQIKKLIPHREPILLIDRLIEMEPHKSAVGEKYIDKNAPVFAGHFPNFPIYPGVYIVEGLAQTAAVMISASLQDEGKNMEDALVYFLGINKAKFRAPVVPDDTLTMHVTVLQSIRNVWKLSGKAMVNGTVNAEAEFTAMLKTEGN